MLRSLSSSALRGVWSSTRSMSSYTYTLPDLPYDYNALEPHISAKIMELHHSKHHAAYVKNLNEALAMKHECEEKGDIEGVIIHQQAVHFNGGGHINHSIFWKNLCPPSQYRPPEGKLMDAIAYRFKDLNGLIAMFNTKAMKVNGSGWAWLSYNHHFKILVIEPRPNQDPQTVRNKLSVPLLGIDVWEHAYYLQYENRRAEYLKAIWNVVNWKDVEERYLDALANPVE